MRTGVALNRPNGHQTHRIAGSVDAKCPTCEQPITATKFSEIQGKLRAHDADIERAAEARFASREAAIRKEAGAAATAALTEKIAKTEQAKKVAEQQFKKLKSDQDATLKARLEAEREAATKKIAEAVTAEKVKAFEEKTRLTEQLADMQRRLENKTAHELGEPAEVDLFTALEKAFPDDRISRVRKGTKGPDVIMEIIHQGAAVGSIALDSKNHARWSNAFTRKLHADQLAWGSDWAILSTASMPAGARQLHIQDGVIVADPARVIVLVHLLRRQLVENHHLKLSTEARDEKAERLLTYITSPPCTDLFDRIAKLTGEITDLDKSEMASHERTFSKRATLIKGIQEAHTDVTTALSAIMEGNPS